MTRNELMRYAKKYGITVAITIPLLIALNLLIGANMPLWAMIIMNCAIIFAAFFITLFVADKNTQRIARKREAFLIKKEEEEKFQRERASRQVSSEPVQPEAVKIIQKQKKQYTSVKRKKK